MQFCYAVDKSEFNLVLWYVLTLPSLSDAALDTGRSKDSDPSFIKLKNPATGGF